MRSMVILGGLGLAIAGAASASAQTNGAVNFPFTVTGSAPEICAVSNPVLAPGPLVNFQSLNGTTLQLSQLADSKTLATNAASASVTFSAVCNYPHQIVLESQNNGLYRDGSAGAPPPSGFADGVPYTAQLTWGPVTSRFFVPATSRETSEDRVAVPTAVAGDIKIDLTIQAGASNLSANSPLIAGVYSDTLRVTVEPQ